MTELGAPVVPRKPGIGPTHHAYNVLAHAVATQPGNWDTDRAYTVLTTAGCDVRRDDAWGLLQHLTLHGTPATAPPAQLTLFP